ncbi:alpha/beta hydrolase [Dankookia rubra]|uniref:Alpha/beta hydrolase n=1 Tax=Dankookia rubra TaxID=1442381 RepID=A0A4V3A9I9_9PROT|nr:alpha/beta hydrolase [Dankookia rubra]
MSAAARIPLVGAAVLGALAVLNGLAAKRAERRHPPQGRFVEVDGVRLHYTDRGEGPPVLLVHGNLVSGGDWDSSGVTAQLLQSGHRVIAFDRPGFGHSDRPRGKLWTSEAQAGLLFKATGQLGVERPVVVGHSWGAIVALAMALRHQADIAGAVLVSGYYFWTLRPDVLPVTLAAIPGLGDILRYTVSPLLGRLMLPLAKRAMFSPREVPERFSETYSDGMALRPSQLRATADDGALMIPGALEFRDELGSLATPTVILAGAEDKVVFSDMAERLHAALPHSILHVVRGAGHMVHYAVPRQLAATIAAVARSGALPEVTAQAA